MDQLWHGLAQVLLLLLVAVILGGIAERLRQSAILGYLLAGTLLGPNTPVPFPETIEHAVVTSRGAMEPLAELGVALLLFTIGLEFSWRRLRRFGATALLGGTAQVIVTHAIAATIAWMCGANLIAAIAIGSMIALSSTACVLRVLIARAELESVHGRLALGILLLQDLAVVPLVILVSLLGEGGDAGDVSTSVLKTMAFALGLVVSFYVLFNILAPRVLRLETMRRNRELPILLAIIMGLGSAWAAHSIDLSPAMGAFVAGMLLAESPFAAQIRADVGPLRTLLMTIFFTSIGMLGDLEWIMQNLLPVIAVVAGIVAGKAVIIWIVLRMFRQSHAVALSTGLCLAQVGEFSFVLATLSEETDLISDELFTLVISATIATLFLTPLMVKWAPRLGPWVTRHLQQRGLLRSDTRELAPQHDAHRGHVVIIGFGPAGQAVAETLLEHERPIHVVDLNTRSVGVARRLGFHGHVGDATSPAVLEHLHITGAAAVAITVPDPMAARTTIQLVRALAPETYIIARARYHIYRWELEHAGADVVLDEEQQVGGHMSAELHHYLGVRAPRYVPPLHAPTASPDSAPLLDAEPDEPPPHVEDQP